RRLAGMLQIDEGRAVVGSDVEAGDLAAARTGEEAAEHAGRGIDRERLVVAERGALALAQVSGRHVGLDPQRAHRVDPQAVGIGEAIALDRALAFRAGANEHLPLEARGRDIAAFLVPAHDVPERVSLAA